MQIRLENIVFNYSDDVKVLKNISLGIFKGECVALIGHNGSGNTSLAKHLNGLLRPSKGKIWIGDSYSERKRVALASIKQYRSLRKFTRRAVSLCRMVVYRA